MIEITLANGDVRQWCKDEYTDYDIKGRFLSSSITGSGSGCMRLTISSLLKLMRRTERNEIHHRT